MNYSTGDIVIISGIVESCVYEPIRASVPSLDVPLDEHIILPQKYGGTWPEFRYRYLHKLDCAPTKAMVLGWTMRNLGHVWRGHMHYDIEYGKEWEPGGMMLDESVKVWIVMPLGNDNRYRKPVAVLPEQIFTEQPQAV